MVDRQASGPASLPWLAILRLRRQMADEMGREVEPPPPLRQPQGNVVPWHHRSGPIGGGLNIISAEEAACLWRAMPRVLMPGKAIPPF